VRSIAKFNVSALKLRASGGEDFEVWSAYLWPFPEVAQGVIKHSVNSPSKQAHDCCCSSGGQT
jgi:hypothetical protein